MTNMFLHHVNNDPILVCVSDVPHLPNRCETHRSKLMLEWVKRGIACEDGTIIRLPERLSEPRSRKDILANEVFQRRKLIHRWFDRGTLTFNKLFRIKYRPYDTKLKRNIDTFKPYGISDARYDFKECDPNTKKIKNEPQTSIPQKQPIQGPSNLPLPTIDTFPIQPLFQPMDTIHVSCPDVCVSLEDISHHGVPDTIEAVCV